MERFEIRMYPPLGLEGDLSKVLGFVVDGAVPTGGRFRSALGYSGPVASTPPVVVVEVSLVVRGVLLFGKAEWPEGPLGYGCVFMLEGELPELREELDWVLSSDLVPSSGQNGA